MRAAADRGPAAHRPSEAAGDEATGSLARAVQIVRTIAGRGPDGVSMAELVRSSGLPRSTLHRVSQMLVDAEWLERDEAGRFFLGRELHAIGLAAAMHHPIERLAAPCLLDLKREVGQTIYLSVVAGDDAVCVARYESSLPVQMLVLNVGSRQPLGLGAGGMALLAALPEATIRRVIEVNRPRYMERGAFDEAAFRVAIASARQAGFAMHDGLFTHGISGLGVAVKDAAGYPLAAISTAFVSQWLDARDREKCVRAMRNAAQEIARELLSGRNGRPASGVSPGGVV